MRRFIHAMVLLCVLATPALAQDGHWYMGLKGGVDAGPDADVTGLNVPISISTETGAAVLWTVGRDFGGLRVESELSWRRNDLDQVTGPGGSVSAGGSLRNFAWMVNGIYEVPMTNLFTPFLLGGIGLARIEGEVTSIAGYDVAVDDDETSFAYQVGAGVEYLLSKDFAFEVSYRFFGTPTVTFSDVDVNNTHHTGLVGLTLAF